MHLYTLGIAESSSKIVCYLTWPFGARQPKKLGRINEYSLCEDIVYLFFFSTILYNSYFIYKFKVLLQGLFLVSVILKTRFTLAVFLSFALSNSLKDSSVSCTMGFCSLTPYSSMLCCLNTNSMPVRNLQGVILLALNATWKLQLANGLSGKPSISITVCSGPSTFMEHQSSVTRYWYTSTGIPMQISKKNVV